MSPAASVGCVSGEEKLPVSEKARRLARLAACMQAACTTLSFPDGSPVTMRVGLHLAPAVAGVVGNTMLRYHLFGFGMDEVVQMEQSCEVGGIHVSEPFARALGPAGESGFCLLAAPSVSMQGWDMPTYHLAEADAVGGDFI